MSSTVTATESFSSSRPLHILSKQRKCLLEAIEEARTAEEKRLDRLDYVKSKKEEKMLEKRFEIERNKDKVRLDYLLQDYNVLKNAIASGDYDKQVNLQKELSQSLTLPSNQQQSLDRRGLPLKNRFAGLDDPIDIINWKQTIAKFDRTDRKFQGRGIKFNEYEEKKKLQLLYDKQSILKQLINIQKNETDTKQISNSNNSSRYLFYIFHFLIGYNSFILTVPIEILQILIQLNYFPQELLYQEVRQMRLGQHLQLRDTITFKEIISFQKKYLYRHYN